MDIQLLLVEASSPSFSSCFGKPFAGRYLILIQTISLRAFIQLMEFAGGRIVMALEGGYNLDSIANSALACVEVLLEEKNITSTLEDYPFGSTWRLIQLVYYVSLLVYLITITD